MFEILGFDFSESTWLHGAVVLKVFFYITPLQTQILSIPPQQRSQMIFAKISHYLLRRNTRRLWTKETFYNISHCRSSVQFTAIDTLQVHGPLDHGASWQPQIHRYTDNCKRCDASRTTSHRDPSWHSFFSTSTSMTWQSRTADTSSHFTERWHSWSGLLALARVLEQQRCEQLPYTRPFNSRVLRSCLVPQCSHPPHWPRHQWRLVNCDWMRVS